MFKDSKAFFSFSVNDLKKAAQFYGQTLGLEVEQKTEGLFVKLSGGSSVFLYPKPNHVPATFTVLNFPVSSIEQAVADLGHAGVQFEHYDQPEIKTDEKGIARTSGPMIAWFKDPAGNILSVFERK